MLLGGLTNPNTDCDRHVASVPTDSRWLAVTANTQTLSGSALTTRPVHAPHCCLQVLND